LHVLSKGGVLRTAYYDGTECIVVPVTALVEGVIHAVNAETPELVLASEFSVASGSWNGRPIMMGHPDIGGEKVSANSPDVLESQRFGTVFATRVAGNRLEMEAWLNPIRAAEMGGDAAQTLQRVLSGKPIEVSVGVFIKAEPATGIHNGQRYNAIWRQIAPDHLAFLGDGMTGACSVAMGCGARTAAAHSQLPADGYAEALKRQPAPHAQTPMTARQRRTQQSSTPMLKSYPSPPAALRAGEPHEIDGYKVALAARAQEGGR
jgi:hypothetical protein